MKEESYKNIFKTTFLFGFVQVFNILVKVITNKIVAILLGAEGMGIISLFNTTISLLKSGASLGISQSAVRDISEASQSANVCRFSRIISTTHDVMIFTSLLGIVITVILSPYLSRWSFGNNGYTLSFTVISLVVGMNIFSDGQLAILTGMRKLRQLAKASMIGSVVGLLSAVPFYYLFGKNGIVPSLLVTAFSSLFFSSYFVWKIKYDKIKLSIKELYVGASPMVKMGIALMLVTFLGSLFDLAVSAYIRSCSGLNDVGYYQAGIAIISGYFGIVITAMSTDYYPRISAIHNDNTKLTEELNKQSETGLILIFPLVILFVFLAPFVIPFLYSKDFIVSISYTDYAILGSIIIIVSNCTGMILLAKQVAKIFIVSVLLQRLFLIGIYMLSYKYWGLSGLGFAYIISGVVHILFMSVILKWKYNIYLQKRVYKLLLLVICAVILTLFFRNMDVVLIRYTLGIIMFLFSFCFSYWYMKNQMNLNFLLMLKSKFIHKK